MTADYLLRYFTRLQEQQGAGREDSTWLVSYNPRAFHDFSPSHCGEDTEDMEGREETLTMKEFRNLEFSDLSRRDALIADDPTCTITLRMLQTLMFATYRVQA
ncbi:hypothetical protein Aduo_018318 [Ancylostoma duodenale]